MRLSTIRELRADHHSSTRDDDAAPRDADEAAELFERGMRAMRAGDDETACRLFSQICMYTGSNAPPGLLSSARACRDYLDPDRSPEQKAQTLFAFFRPSVLRVYEADHDGP